MLDHTRNGAASDLLRTLAERTVHEPEPRGIGRYHYVHTSSSYLHTVRKVGRKGDSRGVRGSIEHLERRQWIASDGSGRLLVTQDGESVQPTGHYPPGRLTTGFITTTDPVALAAELRKRNPKGSSSVAMNTFTTIWNNQVVPSMLQRLLLLDLAGYPDLSVQNTTQNATGGLADGPRVAVEHIDQERHTRHLLVFNQKTGALIGAEVIALDGANVPIPTPAIITSTEWLHSGYSTTTIAPPQ